MAIVIGADVGTTTITALALDSAAGEVLACCTVANDAETTSASDRERGRSEWDAVRIARRVCDVLKEVSDRLGDRRSELAGICLTGQQHGVVLVDRSLQPVTPFVNWQDQRGDEVVPGGERSYVSLAAERLGEDALTHTGCSLATGFLGTTLFHMRATGVLPQAESACFVPDYVASGLTGVRPVTDPTFGASSGVFDVAARQWAWDLIGALDLPPALFPEVRNAGEGLGTLTGSAARGTGLPEGTPVFVGLGDNQASFLGSVADPGATVLVNIGTGGQVAVYSDRFACALPTETRPFPHGGYLLVNAGLCGGRAYALLESFFAGVAEHVLRAPVGERLYSRMNDLAAGVPRGAAGLRCDPFFAGSRADPERRGTWTGVSVANFTPAHMARALLEGMARTFRDGYEAIVCLSERPRSCLVGAGNGLRENPVLAQILSEEFGLPLLLPRHREEAAYGAALVALHGAGICPDLALTGRHVRYVKAEAAAH